MNRRIANQAILWLNLADMFAAGFEAVRECLRMILSHNMLPMARREAPLDKDAEALAAAAAQVGLDRVAAGRMYRDTARYERDVLLRDAARRGWRVELVGRDRERRRASGAWPLSPWRDWPAWMTALYFLLLLTRRPWTYLSLYTARRPRRAWHGELSEIYLGARERQASLTRSKAPLRALIDDLHDAWTEVQGRALETDAGRWLGRLEQELGADVEPQDAHRYARLAVPVLASLHGEEFADPDRTEDAGPAYPALREACRALVRMTRLPGAAPGEHDGAPLLAALDELVPGLAGEAFPDDGALRRWLDGVPARPADDRPPKTVLRAIRTTPRVTAPSDTSSAPSPDADTLNYLMELYEPGSFEQAVLIRLSGDCDRDRVLTALAPDFPPPDALDGDVLEEVKARLTAWSRHVGQMEQGRLPAYHEQYLWMEVPRDQRNTAALAAAGAWLGRPDGSWPPAAAAALFTLTLDHFADLMAGRDRGGSAAAL